MNTSAASSLSAVLLAAGESRRMGPLNKLALPIAGTPMLRRTAEMLANSGLAELVVVVGHEQGVARGLLRGLPARIVYNPDFEEGQMTSVYHGLAALRQACDGVMICLSDQVLLDADDIETIAHGFASCPTSIMVPFHKGRRGNPIVMDFSQREAILAERRNLGCKRLIEKNPELVTVLEMPNDHVLVDIDTPQAYTQIQERLPANRPATIEPSINTG